MNHHEQIHHARMLLNFIESGEDEFMHFVSIGPKAMQKLEDERLLATEEKLHEDYMKDKYDLDAAVNDYADWLDVNYCDIGGNYIHRSELGALEAIVFDLSLNFIGQVLPPAEVVGCLRSFVSKHDMITKLPDNKQKTKRINHI